PPLRASAAVAARLAAGGPVLCEAVAREVLAAWGLPVGPAVLATDAAGAVAAWRGFGGPVALKLQSPDLPHKTEAGGVRLDLDSAGDVAAAFADILAAAVRHAPGAELMGVLVQPMAAPGREVILGINRDPAFGPMLMVGLGGVYVEVMKDVAFSTVPLSEVEAHALLDRLKGRALLDGVRGEPPADVAALVRAMVALSAFAADFADRIDEIDLNPVLVHPEGQGLTLADALLVKRS
ncbi:MAG: acetate--CoA ligase family protein, partial [Gammaproteobacteria bacterium]|nr:acetate--CoA ligase family protein [Gammaproteobacteria bacterium]